MKIPHPMTCIAGIAALLLMLPAASSAGPGKAKGNKGGPPGQSKKVEKNQSPAPGKGKDKDTPAPKMNPGQGKGGKDPGNPSGAIVRYVARDQNIVIDYFTRHRDQPGNLPPGLQKRLRDGKPLPPGWQKKLAPGWVITDDWWGNFTPLSYSLFPGLRVVPNTGLYWHADRVVRVYEPRREVLDVIIVPTINIGR